MANLLTKKEVSEKLKVSEDTVDNWVKHGILTPLSAGGVTRLVRFNSDEVEAVFKKRNAAGICFSSSAYAATTKSVKSFTADPKLKEVTLKDGCAVVFPEGIKAGAPVFIKNANDHSPLPPGDYELSHGKKIHIKTAGITDSIGEENIYEKEVREIQQQKMSARFKAVNDIGKLKSKKKFTRDPSDKELQLKDGTRVIALGGLKVGSTVLKLDPGGVEVPLITGDHELIDGTKIRIIDGGLIDAISKNGTLPKPATNINK